MSNNRRGNGGNRWRVRHERGQAVVELALIASILALMVLGAVDFARAYGVSEQLTNAAHEGAKVAARYYDPNSGYTSQSATIAGYVKQQIVQEGLLNSSRIVSVSVSDVPYSEENVVSVTVQYRFTFYGPWSLIGGLSNYVVSATSSEVVQ